MVWMPDSERAAAVARDRGMALGLHLNLTLPFPEAQAPARVADRQKRLTELLGKDSWYGDPIRGLRAADVRAAVEDQLAQFRSLVGEPTHINGHHHVHLADAVLESLPEEIPIRQAPT